MIGLCSDVQKRSVVVDEESERVVEDPFHARPPTLGPDGLEGRYDVRRHQMSLAVWNILKDVEADRRHDGVEVDAIQVVGDRLCQVAVRVNVRVRATALSADRPEKGLSVV